MMNLQELEVACPAAFSTTAAPHVSDRYTHVRTADIVERMMGEGFTIRSASQQKTQKRTAGKEAFQKHRISMQMPVKDGSTRALGQIFPTVDLINSGDWSSTFTMAVGLFRLVCTNGMVAPFGAANESIKVRHDKVDEDTFSAIQQAMDKAPALFQFAEDAQAFQMSYTEIERFGREAARIRFGLDPEDTPDSSMTRGLLAARRGMDSSDDLWSVFNRVQENGTRGGFKVPDANNRLRRVRERRNIVSDVKWNQDLWSLTQSVLTGNRAGPDWSLN
jgi:hypothetical protein